jgi:hypothetical protein
MIDILLKNEYQMNKSNVPESPKERKFNFGILVVVRITALVLSVLTVASLGIDSISTDQAFPMLLVAFVLLCLADLQDTFSLNSVMKILESRHDQAAKCEDAVNNIAVGNGDNHNNGDGNKNSKSSKNNKDGKDTKDNFDDNNRPQD